MLHTAEVALRRIGEQAPPAVAAGTLPVLAGAVPERGTDIGIGDPEIGGREPDVAHRGAERPGELPQAVHRVVIVCGQHEARLVPERVRLPDQAARTRRVGSEDDRVFARRGVEITQNRLPGLFDQHGGRA
jgi:hypothetical protein